MSPCQAAPEPFNRTGGIPPYEVQHKLQDMMQDLVGIVRREEEMERALVALAELKELASKVVVPGNREIQSRVGIPHSTCAIC